MAAGILHQGILELFRHDPWLAFDLLGRPRPVDGVPLDRRAEVERTDPERPGRIRSDFPDLVLVHQDPDNPSYGIVIVVEAQTELDPHKRWMLPWYQAAAARDHRLPAWVVVVSFCDRFSAAIATWSTGAPPRVDVLLIDAHTVAPMLDPKVARNRPTAAVLAATLHGCRGDIDAARIAIRACLGLPRERRESYVSIVLASLSKSNKQTLKGSLDMAQREQIWEIERRSGTFLLGKSEGLKEGRKAGRKAGLEAGIEKGRRDTLVELVCTVLDVRGVTLSAAERARVRACKELPTLERWARQAREVERAAELFEAA